MEKDYPLVSICMPAYNAGKYIAEAVNSIIAQSYQNWELIIVNDGSTDHTVTELSSITDKRVQIYHQANMGQCAAANNAFRFSTGTLIKFMDADDLISPGFIAQQVACLANTGNAIAYANWGRFYNDDISTFKLVTDTITGNIPPLNWLVKSMTGKQAMLQCALWLIPRGILNRAGLWNEELSLINDFEFIIRVLLHADELKHTPDAILYYRSGVQGSLSGTTSAKSALSAFNSIDWGTTHLLNYQRSDAVKKVAANCFQEFIYTFYPLHMDLIKRAEAKVKAYGGASVACPAGGYTKILNRVFGWKAVKKIKSILNKD